MDYYLIYALRILGSVPQISDISFVGHWSLVIVWFWSKAIIIHQRTVNVECKAYRHIVGSMDNSNFGFIVFRKSISNNINVSMHIEHFRLITSILCHSRTLYISDYEYSTIQSIKAMQT